MTEFVNWKFDRNNKEKAKYSMEIYQFEVQQKTSFHLKRIYEMVHEFLEEEGFLPADGEPNNNYERKFIQQNTANGLTFHTIWWRALKEATTGFNKHPYFAYYFEINFITIALGANEILIDGKKFKVQKGEIKIQVSANLLLDYKTNLRKEKILAKSYLFGIKTLEEKFRKRQYLSHISGQKREIYKLARSLQEKLKYFLKLREAETFTQKWWPQGGI